MKSPQCPNRTKFISFPWKTDLAHFVRKLKYHHLMMLPFIGMVFLLSLTPVISRDALIHHMALPKLWLEHGIWSIDTYRTYAFNPANLQVLYYLALVYNLEFLPKLIHYGFLLMTGGLIYRYVRQYEVRPYLASLAFILTITIPINQRLASEVYVDLGLLFFSSLSLIYFLKWKNSGFQRAVDFYIAAIGSGLALGTKYNGFIPFVALACLVLFAHARHSRDNAKSLWYGIQFCGIALLLASPWFIRNALVTGGNPFYPLFTSFFPDQLDIVPPLVPRVESKWVYRALSGESWLDILLIPLRFFYDGEDHNFLRFDGKLNPIMLILLPFTFMACRRIADQTESQPKAARSMQTHLASDQKYLLFFLLFTLVISVQYTIRIRYAIPIITPIIILNIFAFENLITHPKKMFNSLGFFLIGLYISYNIYYSYGLFDRYKTYNYLLFQETKSHYLKNNLHLYNMYDYINSNTPKNAVIYDVMSGHRSYYVDREYLHDRLHLDTIFFNYAKQHKPPSAYAEFLRTLKSRQGQGATHLLIKPYQFINAYQHIFPGPQTQRGTKLHPDLRHFLTFLKAQKPLFQSNDAILYQLVTPNS